MLENINNADKHLNISAGFDSVSSLACARETCYSTNTLFIQTAFYITA